MSIQASKSSKSSKREAPKKREVMPSAIQEIVAETQADALSMLSLQQAAADPRTARPPEILALQRKYGNDAVQRLLMNHNIQARLTVGAANDAYEQEADRVAAQVMSMPEAALKVQRMGDEEEDKEIQVKPLAATITPLVQRSASLEEEEKLQAKPNNVGHSFEPNVDFESRLVSTRGGGKSLPKSTREFMEQRFGADFSRVRVHTDGESSRLNREISAQAFTRGQDIYLGEVKENLESNTGRQLLAHELTHVVQQTGITAQRLSFDVNTETDAMPHDVMQRKPGDEARMSAWRASHSDHVNLISGINESMSEEDIIGRLVENFFQRTNFDYTFTAAAPFTKRGDCGTLVAEFQHIARQCFEIDIGCGSGAGGLYIPQPQKIIHNMTVTGNIDHGKAWYFESHVWAIWDGKPIDVLFGQLGVVEHIAGVRVLPDGEFSKWLVGDGTMFWAVDPKQKSNEWDVYTTDPMRKQQQVVKARGKPGTADPSSRFKDLF